jgi:RNase adapter protein RapZ
MASVRTLIVTGVSGAGKSTALRALEDLGFFCVDNLPLPLLSRFLDLCAASSEIGRVALVVDAREGAFLEGHRESFAQLRAAGHRLELVFLDAGDEVLLRRFSETRRRHPLGESDLRAGLHRERGILEGLRREADDVIDTGGLTVHELKRLVLERYGAKQGAPNVSVMSFGYRYGLPSEADFVLDVRFLPNPFFSEDLGPLPGTDARVASFVLSHPQSAAFVERATQLLELALPLQAFEGRPYVTVAIGCTAGRHRSVAIADELSRRLAIGRNVRTRHRDLGRD